ncbi:MAG: BLUF domain-containing protein [Pseudoxanthomonas sp.]
MHDLSAVAYSSVAVSPLTTRDMDALLVDARSFNQKVQVTGALLHHDGNFFQYFEGPPAEVAVVYKRIRNSSQHQNLVELLNQPIGIRQFVDWHMAFAEAPASVLQEICTDQWQMTLSSLDTQQVRSPGLALLLAYWETAVRVSSHS